MVFSGKGLIKIFTNTLRILGTFSCLLVFLLWTKFAVEKLMSNPISSSITYKNGDDSKGLIEHPIVTVCPADLNFFTVSRGSFDVHCKCGNFLNAVSCRKHYLWGNVFKDCFGKNGYKDINDSTEELYFEIHPLVYQVEYGKQYRVPKDRFLAFAPSSLTLKEKKAVFHPFFHEGYGTCWSFDIALALEENGLVEPDEMLIDFGHPWPEQNYKVAIHEKPEDRIAALESNAILMNLAKRKFVRFEKIKIHALSTDDYPCETSKNYSGQYCRMLYNENAFIRKVGCRLPFMEQLMTKDDNRTQSRICTLNEGNVSMTDFFSIWKNLKNEEVDECPLIKRCQRAVYKLYENFETKEGNDSSQLILKPLDSTVQYIKDDYAYDTQSFIGEVGGTLGLMLGLSFISIFDFIDVLIQKFT